MSSCCCANFTCPWEQVIRFGEVEEEAAGDEDQTEIGPVPTRMDIALLKEQYNYMKEKQKSETRVVVFRKAANNEEISGNSLFDVVPIRQVGHPLLKQASIQDVQSDPVRGLDWLPWHLHLDMHRMTFIPGDVILTQRTSQGAVTCNTIATTSLTNQESTDSSDQLSVDSDGLGSDQSPRSFARMNLGSRNSRKMSAPALLNRQRICGDHRSPHPHTSPLFYPFPQLKCPRKSEAARRLGMYSSF